jgi:hypothetical protein
MNFLKLDFLIFVFVNLTKTKENQRKTIQETTKTKPRKPKTRNQELR